MPLDFSKIVAGYQYSRAKLVGFWGYKNYHAIRRGVVTPRNENTALLFITAKKRESSTQYEDSFEGNILRIDGEQKHVNDKRIVKVGSSGGTIHLFYRLTSREEFTYYGPIKLLKFALHSDKPSRFEFEVQKEETEVAHDIITENVAHGIIDSEYFADWEGSKKIRQHVQYERSRKNREVAIHMHGRTCKICGFNFNEFYGEDLAESYIEIHHITPVSQAERKVNSETDLIPVCSNCHSVIHRNSDKPNDIERIRNNIKVKKTLSFSRLQGGQNGVRAPRF